MFPQNYAEFLARGLAFRAQVDAAKKQSEVADYGWYPYGSLSALPLVSELLAEDFEEIARIMAEEPVADLGCGDGEFAIFFAELGAAADAIDYAPSNFNQMRGISTLKQQLQSPVSVHDVDLDGRFELPRPQYAFALFLGTLYHLKNPFYVLEELAKRSAYCLLSTRIAQKTVKTGIKIASEPVAYLLDAREANDDPTNYWIFSEAGLVRILDRAGWMVRATKRIGCLVDSNPVEAAADERMFVLAKSRFRFPDLQVRILGGFHAIEQESWRWTTKQFALEVVLPQGRKTTEFALQLIVPEAVVQAGRQVKVSCCCGGEKAGAITLDSPGTIEFRGVFTSRMLQQTVIPLEFEVESAYAAAGDIRELGVIVPVLDRSQASTARLPFRIS